MSEIQLETLLRELDVGAKDGACHHKEAAAAIRQLRAERDEVFHSSLHNAGRVLEEQRKADRLAALVLEAREALYNLTRHVGWDVPENVVARAVIAKLFQGGSVG
jgi:hypothetical protein